MRHLSHIFFVALCCGSIAINAQTPGKGEQLAYNQLHVGDSILLANATSISNSSLPETDLDNVFLSGEESRQANYWHGQYTLGVLAGLSEENIFVLEEAPKQLYNGTNYTSFYLRHALTEKYVRCSIGFEGDVYRQGKADLTADKAEATSFLTMSAKAQGVTSTFSNDKSVLLAHVNGNKLVWFGPFANYSFIYYGEVDKDAWNIYKLKWIQPITKQTIQLTTAKAIDEEMTLHVTSADAINVDWGNGEFVSYPAGEIRGQVKGETITVEGSAHMTSLDCSGQALTSINTSDAPKLLTLQCADNLLSALSLSANRELLELDCSGNKLTKLSLDNERLNYLDCSNNELATLSVVKLTALQHLICGGNEISTMAVTKVPDLRTLWCQDNSIRTLSLSSCPKITSVYASRNALTTFTASNVQYLSDLWVDDNSLTKLSLGEAMPQTLNCARNQISSLTMGLPSVNYTPYLIDQSGNRFLMKDFYTARYVTHYLAADQAVIELPFTQVPVGEFINVADYLANRAGTRGTLTCYDAATDTLMSKGTQGKGEWFQRTNEVKFWEDRPNLYFKITHSQYPGLEFVSTPFYVGEGTAIEGITDDKAVSTGETYDLQGRRVEHAVKGIYITNGKKVVKL